VAIVEVGGLGTAQHDNIAKFEAAVPSFIYYGTHHCILSRIILYFVIIVFCLESSDDYENSRKLTFISEVEFIRMSVQSSSSSNKKLAL
jgi:hypothetical protein